MFSSFIETSRSEENFITGETPRYIRIKSFEYYYQQKQEAEKSTIQLQFREAAVSHIFANPHKAVATPYLPTCATDSFGVADVSGSFTVTPMSFTTAPPTCSVRKASSLFKKLISESIPPETVCSGSEPERQGVHALYQQQLQFFSCTPPGA